MQFGIECHILYYIIFAWYNMMTDHMMHVGSTLLHHRLGGPPQLGDGSDPRIAQAKGGLDQGGDHPLLDHSHASVDARLDTSEVRR